VRLSDEEGRVIGSLIEKQLTTPQQYPLTLNALQLACNQSSNRDPVVAYDERTVQDALTSLKAAGLVSYVYPSHGRSVTRYHQVIGERLGLSQPQLALLGVLLLRGPQTAAELRARTDRMCVLEGIAAVEAELAQLAARAEPLVVRLARRPGQKEERWAQLLAERLAEDAPAPPPRPSGGDAGGSSPHDEAGLADDVAALRDEVAELRSEVDRLSDKLERLRRELGGA
jgi:uncharacterized protein YceH (UPF0502 family)